MFFALDYLKQNEKKYPGVFVQLSMCKDIDIEKRIGIMKRRRIPEKQFGLIVALGEWNKYKVFYKFDDDISKDILDKSQVIDDFISVSSVKQMPYPCFAVQVYPFATSVISDSVKFEFTGNVIIWTIQERLHAMFEMIDNNNKLSYYRTSIDVNATPTHTSRIGFIITENLVLNGFSWEDISAIKDMLGIKNFCEIKGVSFSEYEEAFKQRFTSKNVYAFEVAIRGAFLKEQLINVVIQIILYLGSDGSDIESVEEKLKRGDWASIISSKTSSIEHNEIEQALRTIKNVKAFDVGYRTASKYRHSSSGSSSDDDVIEEETTSIGKNLYTLGYGRRRAHKHSYWIGPRAGKPAADPENPQPGEKVRIVKWVEATEIHPELRNDLAIEIPVG